MQLDVSLCHWVNSTFFFLQFQRIFLTVTSAPGVIGIFNLLTFFFFKASTPSEDMGSADPLSLAKLGTGTVEKERRHKKK